MVHIRESQRGGLASPGKAEGFHQLEKQLVPTALANQTATLKRGRSSASVRKNQKTLDGCVCAPLFHHQTPHNGFLTLFIGDVKILI